MVRRRQQPGAHQPSFAQNELLWLAGGSLWNVRNEAPEVRNFVVGERHNSVHAGYETFGDERATHCMDVADSGDCIADHISNHGSTSRPAQFATAEKCR